MGDIRNTLYRHYERLCVALIRCMQQLKNNSADGFCAYKKTAEEIEALMRVCACGEGAQKAAEETLRQMQNAAGIGDTAALSAVLETQAYPMVTAWLERIQEN